MTGNRNGPARARGYVMTEILIAAGIATTLVAAIMVRARNAQDRIGASTIAEQMIAARDAVSVAYAGQADYAGLRADWKLLAARLPQEMLVKGTGGAVTGLRNASGGYIHFWNDSIMAFQIAGDPERRWCRDIVIRVVRVFGAVNVWDNASGTYRTAHDNPEAACSGTGNYLIDVHLR